MITALLLETEKQSGNNKIEMTFLSGGNRGESWGGRITRGKGDQCYLIH